ncbi:MAG TPA: tetratricopeptide repeat protein [Verrucomicrobiae bacterium]|nr:tetratricopeptide repeat protein [Verrucomicrobiae bacterium]
MLILLFALVALLPFRSPAPLYYSSGEGWYYEPYGEKAEWQRPRAKEQLEVADQAFTNQNYNITLHAAHRVLRMWPLSDYAPRAEYLIGRCLEVKGKDEAAFNAYESLIQKYPHSDDYDDVLWRQYQIANRFLDGEWFKLWGVIPLYPSMDRTAGLFSTIVTNGPFSDVAPHAQLRIGAAREKQENYPDAVSAYATAADRYYNQPLIAADALYREGVSYQKQAATAEYDQGTAGQAIASFTDFITLYPNDPRVPKAQTAIAALKMQQVEGNFRIALFYEQNKVLNAKQRRDGALVYYSQVVQLDPNSPYAERARKRIEQLKASASAKTPPAG